jgi:hypothetical protein
MNKKNLPGIKWMPLFLLIYSFSGHLPDACLPAIALAKAGHLLPNSPTPQHPNSPTFQLSNFPTSQHPNSPTFPTPQLSNSPTPQLLLMTRAQRVNDKLYQLPNDAREAGK